MRVATVPAELAAAPFRWADAERAGLTRRQLRSKAWRRLLRDVYVAAALPDTVELRVEAVRLVCPPGAVVADRVAAWVHGADVLPRAAAAVEVEVVVRRPSRARNRPGLRVSERRLQPADVVDVGGLLVTSGVRTAYDLARGPDLVESVVAVDGLLHAGALTAEELTDYAQARPGERGVRQVARVVDLAEPLSESPMETRLRLVLVCNGLPRPVAQLEVRDAGGHLLARLDLAYPDARLAIEYDGQGHEQRWQDDLRRRNLLDELGWTLRHYTARDVYDRPRLIVHQVRRVLLP